MKRTATHDAFKLTFGLSADPVHLGHQQAIIAAVKYWQSLNRRFKQIILIPTYKPNLIADKKGPSADFKQRLWMCQLMAQELRHILQINVRVSKIEQKLYQSTGQTSYTINTLQALNVRHLAFLVSADHFTGSSPKFLQWHLWQQIIRKHPLLIASRPPYAINREFIQKLNDLSNHHCHLIDNNNSLNISSTLLRKLFKNKPQNTEFKELIDEKILHYIQKNNIYPPS